MSDDVPEVKVICDRGQRHIQRNRRRSATVIREAFLATFIKDGGPIGGWSVKPARPRPNETPEQRDRRLNGDVDLDPLMLPDDDPWLTIRPCDRCGWPANNTFAFSALIPALENAAQLDGRLRLEDVPPSLESVRRYVPLSGKHEADYFGVIPFSDEVEAFEDFDPEGVDDEKRSVYVVCDHPGKWHERHGAYVALRVTIPTYVKESDDQRDAMQRMLDDWPWTFQGIGVYGPREALARGDCSATVTCRCGARILEGSSYPDIYRAAEVIMHATGRHVATAEEFRFAVRFHYKLLPQMGRRGIK